MNNLYRKVQEHFLPLKGFKWCRPVDVSNITDDAKYGYILEVYLIYPDALHDKHNDFPLVPEKMKVELVFPYSQAIKDKLKLLSSNVEKFIPNLQNKTNYVVHYRKLKFLIEEGLVVSKVHRVLKFEQSSWMVPYIQFNTSQRKRCKFEEF